MKKDLIKYLHITKTENLYFIEAFNQDIVKVDKEGKLELLTGKKGELNLLGIKKVKGQYLVNSGYKLEEINEKTARKIIDRLKLNYQGYLDFMSAPENIMSSQLNGASGDTLI